MPLKLVPPKAGRTPFYHIRGSHLGVAVNRSARTSTKSVATRLKKAYETDIERGAYQPLPVAADAPVTLPVTFLAAATAYAKAGGEADFLKVIVACSGAHAIRDKPVEAIGQHDLDHIAAALFPNATAATRNRQVYTPIAAVLHHAGVQKKFKRPKGWRGSKATSWLEPEAAFALLDAADARDREFGLLCTVLLYTGMRISEALNAELCHLNLDRATLYLPQTKNSESRMVFLPPVAVAKFRAMAPRPARADGRRQADAGVPFLKRHPRAKLFRFHRGGHLRLLLKNAMRQAALSFPRRQGGFHLFCHTYGTWMHRYAALDNYDLTRTKRWLDPRSAERYIHTEINAEARRAELLPVRKTAT